MKRIFFDNASTTPLDEKVIEQMTAAMRENYGNPSSIHAEGRIARAAIEQARKEVAGYFNASIGEIFFTSGGTESNNMALKRSVIDLGIQRIISTKLEHHCNLHSFETLKKEYGTEMVYLDLDEYGKPDKEQLRALLGEEEKKTMVSLMHANNETGTMLGLNKIARICGQFNVLFHTDTVQTVGYFPIDVSKTRISFMAGAAHKFYGPKGVGFIYINSDNIINPYIDGGAQERNMRGGTENLYGILGLAEALKQAYENLESRKAQILSVRNYMKDQLEDNFEGLHFNGPQDEGCHYKTLSVSFPPSPKAELLLFNLDIAGISVSGGSACSSGSNTGSHVIRALYGDWDKTTIRFSFSHHNTIEEVDYVIGKLKEILGHRLH